MISQIIPYYRHSAAMWEACLPAGTTPGKAQQGFEGFRARRARGGQRIGRAAGTGAGHRMKAVEKWICSCPHSRTASTGKGACPFRPTAFKTGFGQRFEQIERITAALQH